MRWPVCKYHLSRVPEQGSETYELLCNVLPQALPDAGRVLGCRPSMYKCLAGWCIGADCCCLAGLCSCLVVALLQGLGFPQLSNMRTLPVFFNMMTQGLLDAPTFSIYLNPDPSAEPAGEIQFGGMNNARFLGSVNWTPVVEKS